MKAMLKIAILSVLVWLSSGVAVGQEKPPAVPQNEKNLPTLASWAEVAAAAQKMQVPIIVMVSLEGCGFCKTVRQSHLLPLFALEKSGPRAIVRQIEINSTQIVIDVDGKAISHREFAQKLGAKVAPTVFFLNAKAEQIATPLEGGLLPDFYSAYLDDAIEAATKKMYLK
jgi:thioredoxin-related protein